MKLANFRRLKTSPDGTEFGSVEVTEGFLWWERESVRHVFKPKYSSYWRWIDGGDFTPDYAIEKLAVAGDAKKQMEAA